MSDAPRTPIQDAVAKIGTDPEDHVTIGGVYEEGGEAGAMIEAQKDIGKPGGWSAAGAAQWMKQTGWKVAGALRWKPKP